LSIFNLKKTHSHHRELMRPLAHLGKAHKGAIILFFLIYPLCRAQVIELSGGASSLYQSQGGTVRMHMRGYSGTLGAGMINGKFYTGAQVAKKL